MSETAPAYDRKAIQRARASYLRDVLLEPWSLRRIQVRTGLGRSVLATRLNGETALTLDDIELLAPLARMTPEQMFAEILSVELPGLDSNQEPIGSASAPENNVSPIDFARARRIRPDHPSGNGTVTPIIRTAGEL